jgi:hypothetical protein
MSALAEPWMEALEAELDVAAERTTRLHRARRRGGRMGASALATVLLIGGVALAQTTPFHPLASFEGLLSAQRATTPGDAVPASVRMQFGRSHIAGLQIDQTRLMETFPDNGRLYAAPTDKGLLCLVLIVSPGNGAGAACGPQLSARIPISAITFQADSGSRILIAVVARDDVKSVSFRMGGALRTVQVKGNAFWYRGSPGTSFAVARSYIVHLDDGRSVRYPRTRP